MSAGLHIPATVENARRAPVEKIDVHIHLWDRSVQNYPWVAGGRATIHGGMDGLPYKYLISDYLELAKAREMTKPLLTKYGPDVGEPLLKEFVGKIEKVRTAK